MAVGGIKSVECYDALIGTTAFSFTSRVLLQTARAISSPGSRVRNRVGDTALSTPSTTHKSEAV